MLLQQMDWSSSSRTLESVLQVLDDALRAIGDDLNGLEAEDLDPGHEQALLDEGIDFIESLLGAALVTCQSEITLVVSQVKGINDYLTKKGEQPLACCGPDKKDILALDSPELGESSYSEIQVIDAAANYFKHNSEWSHDWSGLTGHQRRTADVLEAAGVDPGCSGVVRTLSEILGNSEYSDTKSFGAIVIEWHAAVTATIRGELVERGLVSQK